MLNNMQENVSYMQYVEYAKYAKYVQYVKYSTSQLLQHVHCIQRWVQMADMHQLLVLWPIIWLYSRLNCA